MNLDRLRVLFTPAYGSRLRNAARAVLPLLVTFGVVDLTAEQISLIILAIEAVFTAGGEVTKRV